MVRRTLILGVVLASLVAAPAALGDTQTARRGDLSATYQFSGQFPNYGNERLQIVRGGTVVYDQPVVAPLCGSQCAPGSPSPPPSSVRILDLEHNGRPDVVLGLFSGGAHCCAIAQVFRPVSGTFVKTSRNFGDPGARIFDLHHDGRLEFLTADDAFAYEFTDFAASGLPIQVLRFAHGRFLDVTRRFPRLIARDAARWQRLFRAQVHQGSSDTVGVIAAWAADEDRLGHHAQVGRYLTAQARAGHLRSAVAPSEPEGFRFIAKLNRFLRHHGYLR